MYFKLIFYCERDCISCCLEFIEQGIKIVQKDAYSFIIKTNKSYINILGIAYSYNVKKIKKCWIRNLFSKVVSKCN